MLSLERLISLLLNSMILYFVANLVKMEPKNNFLISISLQPDVIKVITLRSL